MPKSDDFRDLNDWKLETSLEDDPPCFVHTSYGADRASGINKRAIVERWIPNPEPLGKGASGIVRLHRQSGSDKKMRAVKQVSKFEMERDNIDYKKELLALAKFSGKKRILVSHPQRRPKASEIEKDPWFSGAELQKAIAALSLRNDKHSTLQSDDIGVESNVDVKE
ncbi:camk kinase protein [Rutstroemia sp. NJR-2017a BVV2]|nr:camk kinase protein [Rutstroemia sp. NJR-2017a BVV2]